MKHTTTLSLLFIWATIQFSSCKKSDSPAPAVVTKDYAASIKDKSWWGEITYTGKKTEYYSIYFKADNTLLWSQLSGDYTGHWTVKDNQLSMTFDANSVEIKGTITEDDKLTSISDNTNFYEVNSGALVANPNISLDNTTRTGSIVVIPNAFTLQMKFMAGAIVELKIGNTTYAPYLYTRTSSGAAIRIKLSGTNSAFGVVTADGEVKGSYINNDQPWNLVKL